VPEPANLPSALGEAVDQGRQFLARVESLAGVAAAELAKHEQAGKEWIAERQRLADEAKQLRDQIESVNAGLAGTRSRATAISSARDAKWRSGSWRRSRPTSLGSVNNSQL
jgi:phage shock protein A